MSQTMREALIAAKAHIRWTSFGECRTNDWSGVPPTAAQAIKAIDAALSAPSSEQAQQGASGGITLDFKQASELLECFGGEPAEITLTRGDGHDGPGLYAHFTDLPEEGAFFLGQTNDEAVPASRPAAAAPAVGVTSLREALQFYANGDHFTKHDPDAWDTVSGEPANFWEDEANTATVEDGSIARAALAGAAQGAEPVAPRLKDHQVAKLVNDLRDVAVQYHNHQSLRERIAHLVRPLAASQQPPAAQGAEPEYWQWRKKGQPWSLERTFNSQVFATTEDSEVRGLYASPQPPTGTEKKA